MGEQGDETLPAFVFQTFKTLPSFPSTGVLHDAGLRLHIVRNATVERVAIKLTLSLQKE